MIGAHGGLFRVALAVAMALPALATSIHPAAAQAPAGFALHGSPRPVPEIQFESGRSKSITDLAEHEVVTVAFVCRVLPLTCLAPDIVEAILDGRQPKGLRLSEMLGNGPLVWEEQSGAWGSAQPSACSF